MASGIGDSSARSAVLRLGIAVVLSAGIHGALLFSVSLKSPEPGITYVIHARLGAPASSSGGLVPAKAVPNRPAAAPTPERLAQLPVAVPVDPTYYPAPQVDVHPKALDAIDPAYPEAAALAHMKGKVILLLRVDETGSVRETSVVEAEPRGYFEESALAAFRTARFTPAMKNGRPVRARVLIQVNYDAGVDPDARDP